MGMKSRLRLNWFLSLTIGAILLSGNHGFARIKLLPTLMLVPAKRRLTPPQTKNKGPIQNLQPRKIAPSPSVGEHSNIPSKTPEIKDRPIARAHNLIHEEPKEPDHREVETLAPPKIKPAFGRTIVEAIQNRPKLFQRQQKETPIDSFTSLFCENPYRLVCETSMENIAGTSWPDHVFPRGAQPAFESGKKLLNYLIDHHFDYDDANKRAVKSQLANTRVLVTNNSGPMAYSTPPRVEVPPTYWNLFSVFHELGHMIDFKSTYPLNKSEVAQILRNSRQISNIDTLEALIKDKQAEITADKIAAKGFAFLGDPHLRKLGYEPINSSSLLKTLKSAMGFLCTSPGSPEHPSGKFRINFIGADEDLRAVLGCPVTK